MNRPVSNTLITSLRRAFGVGPLAEATDQQLLEQFAAHQDETAFAALVQRHGPMVWGICQRLVSNQQDAEDCFQATFLVLCRKANSIGQSYPLANWLFGVARRAALNAQCCRARREGRELLCAEIPDRPSADFQPHDDSSPVILEELARLPTRYRLPLLLCGLQGLTHVEASKSLGWPVGTVAGRLSRARTLLRSRLERRGVLTPANALPALLFSNTAPACIPPHLAPASVRGAMALFMAGHSTPADVSATVTALVRGVLKKMLLHRVLTRSLTIVCAALILGGAVEAWQFCPAAGDPLPVSVEPNLGSSVPWNAVANNRRRPDVRLPTAPDAVVLRLDRSIEGSTIPGIRLTVFADGRVQAEVPEGLNSVAAQGFTRYARNVDTEKKPQLPGIKILTSKLSPYELQDLMRFAVFEQELLTFEAETVRASIRTEYRRNSLVHDNTDETTTAVLVQTADQLHELRWPRLAKSMWDFPRVHALRQLSAVERRLAHIYYVMLAGGPQRVSFVVETLDSLLQPYYLEHPQIPYLATTDLSHVHPAADGSTIRYQFCRSKPHSAFVPEFAATIVIPEHGTPYLESVIPPQQ